MSEPYTWFIALRISSLRNGCAYPPLPYHLGLIFAMSHGNDTASQLDLL